jgi:oxalate decarboxylase
MLEADRHSFVQVIGVGVGATVGSQIANSQVASSRALVACLDGHAAGYDVSAASECMKTIARKPGDPVTFTAALDKAPIKATSGGYRSARARR